MASFGGRFLPVSRGRGFRMVLAASLAAVCGLPRAAAAPLPSQTWSGGATLFDNWTNGNNWVSGTAPVANDALYFAGSTRLTNNDNNFTAGTQFNGITFNAGAGAFTLSGNRINLGGDVTNNSTTLQTIALDLALTGANRTFNAASGDLAVSGVASGSSTLVKGGAHTLTLSGSNTYSGGTTLSAGTLALGSAGAIGTSGPISFDGGTLQFSASNTTDYSSRFSSSAGQQYKLDTNGQSVTLASALTSSGGSLTKSGAGTLTLSGSNTYGGGTTLSAGTLAGTTSSLQGNIATSAGTGVTFNQATAGTYAGNLSGAGSLTKSGAGALTLSGSNTYGGGTTLSAGSLVGTTSSLQGDIATFAGTGVTFAQAATGTYAGNLSGAGALTKSGVGTLTLTGSNAYSGATTISSGTLEIGGADVFGAGGSYSGTITNGGALVFASSANQTVTTAIGGAGAITKSGAGSLTFGGATVGLDRSMTVTTGSFFAGTSGTSSLAVGSSGTGTLSVTGGSVTNAIGYVGQSGGSVGTATVTSGTWTNSGYLAVGDSGTGTLNVSGGSVTNTVGWVGNQVGGVGTATVTSGAWTNSGDLLVGSAGTGTLNVSGGSVTNVRAYVGYVAGGSGTATVSGGTWGNTGELNVGYSGSGTLNVSGGSVTNANGWIGTQVGGVGTATVSSGTWVNTGNLVVGGGGTGTLTMSGGLVQVSGTLSRGSAGTIQLNAGGTLQIGTGGTTGVLNTALVDNGTLIFDRSDNSTHAYAISGSGSLVKQGAGTLTLSGSNSYSGGTTVSAGSLVGTTSSLQGNIATSAGTRVTFDQVDGLHSMIYSGNISGGGSLTLSGSTMVNDSPALFLTGSNTYTGGTTVSGVLAGKSASIQGDIAVTYGSLVFIVVGPATSGTYAGNLSGLGSFAAGTLGGQASDGTLTLTGSNSYTGGTYLEPGTLVLGSANAIGTSGAIHFDGGTLRFTGSNTTDYSSRFSSSAGQQYKLDTNGQNVTLASGLTSADGSLTKYGTGTLSLTGSNTFTGLTTIEGGVVSVGDGGTSGSLAGAVTLKNSASLVFNRSDASSYAGSISRTGSLTKLGGGALTLTGSNTFQGDTTVSAGTLVLGSGNALATTAAVTVASVATLQATTPIRIGYLDSSGTVVGNDYLTSTLTVTRSGNIGGLADGADDQGTFAAGIVKLGSGTSTVSAPNTYTGLTWVREGTLAVGTADPFAAGSDLTVDSGATLSSTGSGRPITVQDVTVNGTIVSTGGLLTSTGVLNGSGSITGNVLSTGTFAGTQWITGEVEVQGVHSPGNSAGIQTVTDNLFYTSSGLTGPSMDWELFANGASNAGTTIFDQVLVSEALYFFTNTAFTMAFDRAGSTVDWTDAFWDTNQQWTIWQVGAFTNGFGDLSLTGSDWLDANGQSFSTSRSGATFSLGLGGSGSDVVLLYVAPVPEPSTWAMLVAGAAVAAWRARRRRGVSSGTPTAAA